MKKLLPAHEVRTAEEMLWNQLSNGDLLKVAEEAGFEVLLTADQSIFYQQNNFEYQQNNLEYQQNNLEYQQNNLEYQQNNLERLIALVVLTTNDWSAIAPQIDAVAAALARATPGSFELVRLTPVTRRGGK